MLVKEGRIKTKWGPYLFEKIPIRHSGNRGHRTRQVTVIMAGLLSQGLPHPFFPVTVSQNPCGLFLPVPPF
jgi:hypothetical protein